MSCSRDKVCSQFSVLRVVGVAFTDYNLEPVLVCALLVLEFGIVFHSFKIYWS